MPAYYGENEGTPAEESAENPDQESSKKEAGSKDAPTALLPKSFFMGKEIKPGDHWEIVSVAVHDDEVEVRYFVPEKGEEKEKGAEPEMGSEEEGAMAGGGNPGGGMGGMY